MQVMCSRKQQASLAFRVMSKPQRSYENYRGPMLQCITYPHHCSKCIVTHTHIETLVSKSLSCLETVRLPYSRCLRLSRESYNAL